MQWLLSPPQNLITVQGLGVRGLGFRVYGFRGLGLAKIHRVISNDVKGDGKQLHDCGVKK